MQATWPKRWPRRGRGRLACLPALLPAFKCNSKVNEATQASFHCAANLIGFNSTAAPAASKKKYEYHMAAKLAAAASQVLLAQVAWQPQSQAVGQRDVYATPAAVSENLFVGC